MLTFVLKKWRIRKRYINMYMRICIKTGSTDEKRKVILDCGWELGKMAYG